MKMLLILLSLIAATLLLWSGFVIGRAWHRWTYKLSVYMDLVKTKMQPKPVEPPKPTTTIIDPDDLVQRAKYERDQMMTNLNEPEIRE